MSDSEPPEPRRPVSAERRTGGSLRRLRTLLRLLRRPREPRDAQNRREDAASPRRELDSETPITPQERFLIGNILKVHERNAADVMVPRVDIVALDVEQPFAEVVKCWSSRAIRACRSIASRSTT